MNLSQLKPPPGQKHKQQRVGHGMGSGRGKYSGRGAKGAKSVSGYSRMRGFEGGQMPLHRRLPKRGFTNIFGTEYAIVNLGRLDRLEGDSFDPARLLELGAIRKLKDGLKVLGTGDLKRKIHIKAHMFSASAREKIEAAGGTAEVIVRPPPKPDSAGAKRKAPRVKAAPRVEPAAPTPDAAAPKREAAAPKPKAAAPKAAAEPEAGAEKSKKGKGKK